MPFIANEKMQESGQKWAKGLEPNPAKGVEVTEFEKKAQDLGLSLPRQYVASKALKQWCVSDLNGSPRYDVLYIPEFLLRAWNIRTMWDGDDSGFEEFVPFSDMTGTDFQSRS